VGDPARDQVELADGLFGPLTEGALVATAAIRARMPISVPVWCHQDTEKGRYWSFAARWSAASGG